MRCAKYIISQHTSFTVVISTEQVNCIQLSMQQRLLLWLKTFRHSINVLMIIVLYCFINLALNPGVSTMIDTRNWQQWYCSERLLMKRSTPVTLQLIAAATCDVIICASPQCVLLSVIAPCTWPHHPTLCTLLCTLTWRHRQTVPEGWAGNLFCRMSVVREMEIPKDLVHTNKIDMYIVK